MITSATRPTNLLFGQVITYSWYDMTFACSILETYPTPCSQIIDCVEHKTAHHSYIANNGVHVTTLNFLVLRLVQAGTEAKKGKGSTGALPTTKQT